MVAYSTREMHPKPCFIEQFISKKSRFFIRCQQLSFDWKLIKTATYLAVLAGSVYRIKYLYVCMQVCVYVCSPITQYGTQTSFVEFPRWKLCWSTLPNIIFFESENVTGINKFYEVNRLIFVLYSHEYEQKSGKARQRGRQNRSFAVALTNPLRSCSKNIETVPVFSFLLMTDRCSWFINVCWKIFSEEKSFAIHRTVERIPNEFHRWLPVLHTRVVRNVYIHNTCVTVYKYTHKYATIMCHCAKIFPDCCGLEFTYRLFQFFLYASIWSSGKWFFIFGWRFKMQTESSRSVFSGKKIEIFSS